MKVLLLGFALPEDLYQRWVGDDPSHTISSHRFGWALTEALRAAGAQVSLLCAAPVTDYPHNRRLVLPHVRFETPTAAGQSIPFVNLLGLKHISRYASARWLGRDAAVDAVLVHGVNSAMLHAGLALGRHLDVPVAAVITDPPAVPHPYDSGLDLRAKRLDVRLVGSATAALDGVIALTQALAEDFAPGRPSLLMDGIYQPEPVPPPRADIPEVVYAGWLTGHQGVPDLVEAARRDTWTLGLYGSGDFEVHDLASVTMGGMVPAGGPLLAVLAAARLLVIPRVPDPRPYGFPSKLLEYLASGTPVVTTRVVGQEYAPYVVFSDPGPDALGRAIAEVLDWSPDTAREFGQRGRQYVMGHKTPEAQGRRMLDFLSSLTRGEGAGR